MAIRVFSWCSRVHDLVIYISLPCVALSNKIHYSKRNYDRAIKFVWMGYNEKFE